MKSLPSHSTTDQLFGDIISELTEQLERGESVDLSKYASQYPEVAEDLKQLFPALETMVRLGQSAESKSSGAVRDDLLNLDHPTERRLGDFEILEEIGRGGMGIVYAAEQISMQRQVALKVLPFAAVMDEKAITRFKNEARAAGTLHHPHIVPIHAVGNERGVYYYAMSLIEGMSVAEVIRKLTERVVTHSESNVDGSSVNEILIHHQEARKQCDDPIRQKAHATITTKEIQAALTTEKSSPFGRSFFEQIAKLGCQAAEALQHAHEHGIVHRDVKPGNLLVDLSGKLWVTDFGLARMENDAAMTVSGDLLGTLRYMAPEQALAKRYVVDHRADIYSLGATLYEWLTLCPAIDGENREDLLKQLSFDEPKPLRQRHYAVPIELETIVLKAMAKNPDERYATAQEFANDLRAFRKGQPIQAKPLSMVQRVQRWAHRHQRLVLTTSFVFVLLSVVLGVSNFMIAKQRNLAQQAQQSADQATKKEEAQRMEAEQNLLRAREVVDTFLTKISQEKLFDVPQLQPLRKELLEQALSHYQEMVESHKDDPTWLRKLAKAYRLAATSQFTEGDVKSSAKTEEELLQVYEKLLNDHPNDVQLQWDHAKTISRLANRIHALGRKREGLAMLNKALMLGEELNENHPDQFRHLCFEYLDLGLMLSSQGKKNAARTAYENVLKQWDEAIRQNPKLKNSRQRLPVASSIANLGTYWKEVGQHEKAIGEFERAIKIEQELLEDFPGNGEYTEALALSSLSCGNTQMQLRRFEEALENTLRAVELLKKLHEDNPQSPQHTNSLAQAYHGVGVIHQVSQNTNEATLAFQNAIRHFDQLAANHSAYLSHLNMAKSCDCLGKLSFDAGRVDEAVLLLQKGIEVLEKLVDRLSQNPEYVMQLARLYGNRHFLFDRLGRESEAIASMELAAKTVDRPGIADSRLPMHLWIRATTKARLADAYDDLGRSKHAWNEYAIAFNLCDEFVDEYPKEALRLAQANASGRPFWRIHALVSYRVGEIQQSLEASNNAMEHRNGGDGIDWLLTAMANHRLGNHEETQRWHEKASAWFQENKTDAAPLQPLFDAATKLILGSSSR